jgi:hypothetical protein
MPHILHFSYFQFPNLPNNVSLPFYDEVKLQYWNSPRTHRKLYALCISATMQVFVCHFRKGLQMHWKGLTLTQRIFPVTFHELPHFHFSVLLVKRLEYLKGVTKMWNLPVENQWFYCFQMFYGTREWESMSSVTSRNDFVMQKYSVKKQGAFFYSMQQNYKKKLKTEYNFFV